MSPRYRILIALLLVGPCALFALAQTQSPYKLELKSTNVSTGTDPDGKTSTFVTVKFRITRQGQQMEGLGSDYKILIEEEGEVVEERTIPRAKVSDDLSVVLAMDISGSMEKFNKIASARSAAEVFFKKLPAKADAGLILFDDLIRAVEPLSKNRGPLLQQIAAAKPKGGTAYFDACIQGIDILKVTDRNIPRALVVMTDGVDMNSKATLEQVISNAQEYGVKVYPVGIGRPGGEQKFTSVLVLDRSGSMLEKASDNDKASKLEALKIAAKRFVDSIRDTKDQRIRTSLIEFNEGVTGPDNFTSKKYTLYQKLQNLTANGETALFDATFDAVSVLDAENPSGKKAVIALTDGVDNSSRHRADEVIERAKELKVPLFMLGFGRKGELDETVMMDMANKTGGKYFHASGQKDLVKLFEDLSIELHDDGIDEATLKQLAKKTGGEYYPAQDIDKLELVLSKVTEGIQEKEFEVTFKSRYQRADGLARDVRLRLVRVGIDGEIISDLATITDNYQRRGLIVAQMSPIVYIGCLMGLFLLLALPLGISKLTKSSKPV